MKENFEASLELVLKHEGGWADHPDDPGGPTMKGVTLVTFRRFYGDDQTPTALRNITTAQLGKIYRTGYWNKIKGDHLPLGVDFAAFDGAVNSGPGRSSKWLQGAVGATVDGRIGSKTLEKLGALGPVNVIHQMLDERLDFLQSLSTWNVFGRGWGRRVEETRAEAVNMARGDAGEAAVIPTINYVTVRQGDKGDWVKKMQAALGVLVDGVFGPKTKKALQSFQRAHGLQADGIAGRQTYRAMGLIG